MRKRTAESTRGEENRKMQIVSPKPKEEGFGKEGDSHQQPSPQRTQGNEVEKKVLWSFSAFQNKPGAS